MVYSLAINLYKLTNMTANNRIQYIKSNPTHICVDSTYFSLTRNYACPKARFQIKGCLDNMLFDKQKYSIKQQMLITLAENYHNAFNLFVLKGDSK